MPGSWSDDDGLGDDDHADGHADGDVDSPLTPPVHPDDRLWRHPSELAWGVAPPTSLSAAGAGSSTGSSTDPGHAGGSSGTRLWALALTSAITGAALTLGMVALFAGIGREGTERVVERIGVRDRLADAMVADTTEGVAAVAQSVIPSVVRLEVQHAGGSAVGSGVVVLDDGHIVTNAHVVQDATAVTIIQADGTVVPGTVIGSDPLTDVAVVAPDDDVTGVEWIPAVRGPASELVIGEPAVAVGSPLGLAGAPSVTLGVVSALGRRVDLVDGSVLHGMIQTDAPVADGSSGGALCDRAGRVVGITTSRFVDTNAAIGFATPMEAAWSIAEALMAEGVVHHVWLGIEGTDLDTAPSSVLGLTGATAGSGVGAVMVERVLPDSPAAAAGLEAADVLVALDGARLTSMSELVLALRSYRPGQAVTLDLERAGQPRQLTVTLAERVPSG